MNNEGRMVSSQSKLIMVLFDNGADILVLQRERVTYKHKKQLHDIAGICFCCVFLMINDVCVLIGIFPFIGLWNLRGEKERYGS